MVILTPIEKLSKFFKGKARAHICPDFPLGDSRTCMAVDRDMLTRMWSEMDYRIDVCHITKGGHIERL
jgi:hypothetical protein